MSKIILLVFFLFSTAIFAQTIPREDSSNVIYGLLTDKDFRIKENRKLLATALIKNLQELNKFVPANTPEDAVWLKNEIQESRGNSGRGRTYASSPIFYKFWLKDRIAQLIEELDSINSDSNPLRSEAILWVSVGHQLTSEDRIRMESIRMLVENNIIDPKALESSGVDVDCYPTYCTSYYSFYGSLIIERVAIPSINDI